MRFRNTYQVPAGQKVTVDTPQGTKEYSGGQYVPPEQLANARKSSASGKSKSGKAPEQQGPGWEEIVQEFKNTDVSNKDSVNIASYKIKQFLPIDINVSSNKIQPACRFGAELTVANILNSIPPLQQLLGEIVIELLHPADGPPIIDKVVGKNFTKIGQIDFVKNSIQYWQHEEKPEDLVQNVCKFLSAKLGIFAIRNLYTKKEQYQANEKDTKQKLEQMQVVIKRKINDYSSQHKGKPPEPGTDEELDQMMQQMQQMATEQQLMAVLIPCLEKLEVSVKREGGINAYIQHILNENTKEGVILQFCNIISSANSKSLSGNNTFASAMENLSSKYPDTLSCIKKIFDILTEIANQEAAQQSEEQ
jgi:hypothetical protein